ncbi:MAG: hypothetical protein JW938_01375 [Candidatus Omnitrophica bacterium]|nr:hypothetical protein [Candidatus Omnitrophota bacterium]
MVNVKRVFILLIVIININSGLQVEAMSLVSFADYDFSHLSYDNRIMISADITDNDFQSETSIDSNGDGSMDILEHNTFVTSGDSASLYLGNLHNSYDIARELLFIGIDGTWTSFTANGIAVNTADVAQANDPDVFFTNSEIAGLLDQVALFEIEYKLEDREPNDSPVGENDPYEIVLSDIVSYDESLRFYCGGYGFISSGNMNSFTPLNSAVLFLPSIESIVDGVNEDSPNSAPVPEPTVLLLFGTSVVYLLINERRKP